MSFYLILQGYNAASNRQNKWFCKQVMCCLSEHMNQFVDMAIYSKNHCLCMPNAHKLSKPSQIKKIITDHTLLDAIIQCIPVNSILLADKIEPFLAIQAPAPFANDCKCPPKVLALALPHLLGRPCVYNSGNGLYVFKQAKSSHCIICGCIHHRNDFP